MYPDYCIFLFIILRYLISLTVIFWCSDYLVFAAKLLPYLFGVVPWSYLRGYLLGASSQKGHWIKCNSQFLGCVYFSVKGEMSPTDCGIDVLWTCKVRKGGALGAPLNPRCQRLLTKMQMTSFQSEMYFSKGEVSTSQSQSMLHW